MMTTRRRSTISGASGLPETTTSAPHPECTRTPIAASFISPLHGLHRTRLQPYIKLIGERRTIRSPGSSPLHSTPVVRVSISSVAVTARRVRLRRPAPVLLRLRRGLQQPQAAPEGRRVGGPAQL